MDLQPLWLHFELLLFTCFLACTPITESKKVSRAEMGEFKVAFELKSDSIWQAPDQGQLTDVYLALEMTNFGKQPVRFPVMDKFKVAILYPNGNELMMEGGQNVLIPGKPISDPVPSGGTYLLELKGQLGWGQGEELQLSLKDDFGSIWWIGPLKIGSQLLNMYYENESQDNYNNSDLWSGHAKITPIYIQITD
jgi:hypothetical protein